MIEVGIILLIAGILGLILFLIPVRTGTIWNIGNKTGVCISIFLIAAGTAGKVNPEILALLWKKAVVRGILFAVFVILCIMIFLLILETGCIIKAAKKRPDEKAVVVVLGCKIYGERASLTLISRLEAAYCYMKKHPEALCIVSGGQGDDEPISEAECMYRYLREKGIKDTRIIKEERSTSTRENLLYSMEILKTLGKRNFDGEKIKIAIATSEFHQYRASRIAKGLGIEHGAICGRTPWWLLPTFYVRELYGILYEWIRM